MEIKGNVHCFFEQSKEEWRDIKGFEALCLVAESFIPNPRKLNEVNHKDENKLNNISVNLEWCDRTYNANYGTGVERCARQKHKSVAMIDTKIGKTICVYESARIANEETGISYKSISSVCNGRTKTAGGHFWKFK